MCPAINSHLTPLWGSRPAKRGLAARVCSFSELDIHDTTRPNSPLLLRHPRNNLPELDERIMAKKRARDADGQQGDQAQNDLEEKIDEDESSDEEVRYELHASVWKKY